MASRIDRVQKKIFSKVLTRFILPYCVISIVVSFSIALFTAFSTLPSVVGVLIALVVELVLFAITFILAKSYVIKHYKKEIMTIAQVETSKVIKSVLTKFILILLIFVIVGAIIVVTLATAIGGEMYWEHRAAAILQLLEEAIAEEDVEQEDYNWGAFYNPDNPDTEVTFKSEAQTLVEIAKAEAAWYEETETRGGSKYWDWCRDNNKGLTSGSGVYTSTYGEIGWEWCATFVTYCVYKAGLGGTNGETFGDLINSHFYSCGQMYTYFTNMGFEEHNTLDDPTYVPQPGDIVIFYYGTSGNYGHVGIVEYTKDDGTVVTIEGNVSGRSLSNPYCFNSIVKNGALGNVRKNGHSIYFTPPYKVNEVNNSGNSEISGEFRIGSYEVGSDGYYSQETTKQIVYDFLRIEMGFNNAAAAGVLANMEHESGFQYDKVEYANYGLVYYNKQCTGMALQVPSPGSNGAKNGNYLGIPNIDTTLRITSNLYYKANNVNGYVKYGMGYGLVQWSFGRRTNLFTFCQREGYGTGLGPDSILGQLMYLKSELEGSYYKSVTLKLLNVDNTDLGAYEAGYIWAKSFEVCGGGETAFKTRANYAKTNYWPKYKDLNPSANYGNSAITSDTVDISNCTIIGDSNTIRMVNSGTAIKNAKNVIATVGVGLSTYDTYTSSTSGTTTIPGKTIKSALSKLKTEDLNHVVIMLGTNDYYQNNQTIINKYTAFLDNLYNLNPSAIVTICTVPPVRDSFSTTIKNSHVEIVNAAIKEVAGAYTKLQVYMLDVNNQLSASDMSSNTNDGYHLSSSGAVKAATYIVANCK